MAGSKKYLVPIDFSRNSEVALDHALRLARDSQARLVLVHVLEDPAANVPVPMRAEYYRELQREARGAAERLIRRKKLRDREYRFVLITQQDPARAIAEQARKSRVSMIIMGSHGRTGLKRIVLGSVAEKTLRHARCPVLVVKK
ncbi:MAG: universal stress protein [Deltaproteobacteria bacterium]|nr:universal stress protein [Deltaproteobacteria bacterium]